MLWRRSLNWTAYLSNVNLIAYGDGAIAAGQAYQAFIDSAKGNTHEGYDPFTVGAPQTGPQADQASSVQTAK